MSAGEEDVQEDADHVADERPGGATGNEGLDGPEAKTVAERERDRKAGRGKYQSYQ